MAASEQKLNKIFDQNVEITGGLSAGSLTVDGVVVDLSNYLTSFTETDPTVPSHVKSITSTNITNWNSAYNWGDHADAGYLTSLPTHNHDSSYIKRLGDVTITNFDTLQEGVAGSNETTATNQPYANHNITMTLYNDASAERRAQLFFGDEPNGGMRFRLKQGTTIGWHPWEKIVTSSNIGDYALTSYSETSTLDAVADRGRSTNQQLISTNPAGFRVDSGSYARIELDSTNNWSYIRLQNNGTTTWDIASYQGGNLEWRPGGVDANKMTLSQSGYLTVNGSMKVAGGVIDMNNNDGFVYDDGSNIMYVKLDSINREIIHSANIGSQSVNYAASAGNASSASSVAWSNVSSKPADWLSATNLISNSNPNATAFPSGFYEHSDGANTPTGTWFNYINVRHSNVGNGHGFQLGMSYYDNNLWFRSYKGALSPTFESWETALATGGSNQTKSGYLQSNDSLRAPIFYDSNNTSYYLNPASTSVLGGININGTINMQNNNITNVNHITINDAGVGEGIEWLNGNGWKIYESPDNLTNASGNLQFVTGSTRRMTLNTSGALTVDRIHVTEINNTDVWEGSITVNGDAATYYPVGWYGGSQAEVCEIEIFRNYSETAPSSWNTSTHKGGLVCKLRANFGGWGGVQYDWVLEDFRETYSTMVAWAGHFANSRAFGLKLRGGGAIYHIRIKGRSVAPTVTLGTWDPGNNNTGISSTTSVDSTLLNRRNHIRGNYLYSYDSAVLHEGSTYQTKAGTLQSNVDFRAPVFYDSNDTGYYLDPASTGTSIKVRGTIENPSIWINDGDNYNNYNETIRLFNPINNGPSVIAFAASGISGTPTSSILGYSDRHEVRRGSNWETRTYDGYQVARGSYRAPTFYDSNNTSYYADPASESIFKRVRCGTGTSDNNGTVSLSLNDGSLHFRSVTDANHKMWYYDGVNFSTNPSHGHIRFWADSSQRNASTGGSYLRFDVDCQNATATVHGTFYSTGDIIAYSSDARLKENLRPIEKPLDKLKSIRGVIYDWKDVIDEYDFRPRNRKDDVGVIAQEVEAVMPQVVTLAPFDTEMDDEKEVAVSKSGENYKTVQYEKLVPLLIEAVKELSNKVEELENKLNGSIGTEA